MQKHYDEKFGYGVALLAGSNLLGDPDGPEKGALKIKNKILNTENCPPRTLQ